MIKKALFRSLIVVIFISSLLLVFSELNAQGKWWDKFGEPQYGGTIIVRNVNINGGSFDPALGPFNMMGGGGFATNVWLEGLTFFDWTLDRNTWSYPTGFAPFEYLKGLLAESWDQTDPTTLTVNLRKDVRWHNKPPANGREFVADDVVFNFDRVLGTGHGYTQPNPIIAPSFKSLDRVNALDKYTVQFKLKHPGIMGIFEILETSFYFVPKEWVALGGPPGSEIPGGAPPGSGPPKGGPSDEGPSKGGPPGGGPPPGSPGGGGPLSDWKSLVGTGPWILTSFTPSASMTFSRNPDYYGYDERYPQNKIPYADKLVQLAIPDPATALAAIRTGKIDMWTDMMGALTWQQGKTLKESNPKIEMIQLPHPGAVIVPRCDIKPFSDIRVRKAMQLAIDIQSIGKSYYGGFSDGTPIGLISPVLKEWATPYDQWPQKLKQEYGYNPAKARQLLADAGYSKGFKTNAVTMSVWDLNMAQILKSHFMDIGVDMEIKVLDPPSFSSFVTAGKQDQMVFFEAGSGNLWSPSISFSMLASSSIPQTNSTFNYDSTFDAIVKKLDNITNVSEAQKLSREADLYALQQHWLINVGAYTIPVAWQPYIKGYSGEALTDHGWAAACRARVWLDQDMKKSLGY